jgi:hypothetical protein
MHVQLNKLIVQRYIDLDLYFLVTNQGLDVFRWTYKPQEDLETGGNTIPYRQSGGLSTSLGPAFLG